MGWKTEPKKISQKQGGKGMKKESLIYTVIFTFITAFLFVFLLALAYGATKEQVAENQRVLVSQAYLLAAGVSIDETSDRDALFLATFPDAEKGGPLRAMIDGEEITAVLFNGKGLWGTITAVLAVNSRVDRIIGFEIISHNETPGLGGRIDEDWFTEQFRGESVPGLLTVHQGGSGGDQESENSTVDGITGASRTSGSIEAMINLQLEDLRKGGSGNE